MSLSEFRTLREELKYVPNECEDIVNKIVNKYEISKLLVTAMNALCLADEIISKQADTIFQSTNEMTACIKEMRSMNSSRNSFGPLAFSVTSTSSDGNVFETSDDKYDSSLCLPQNDPPKYESQTQPTTANTMKHRQKGYATVVKTNVCNDVINSTDMSVDDFQKVKP